MNEFVSTPHVLNFPEAQFRFLHIGKAGGGSFFNRVRNFWQIRAMRCHPTPCPEIKAETFVVSLRDPIDRFVSAFSYNILLLCDPKGDPRKSKGGLPWDDPVHYCLGRNQVFWKNRTDILFGKYHKNVNSLAESLCDDEARTDLRQIEHMDCLQDWLPHHWTLQMDRIFPIVLERGFDFGAQVDSSLRWVNNLMGFENSSQFERREAFAHGQECKKLNESASRLAIETMSKQHSSTINNDDQKPKLSIRGEVCLAQYYARDYKIIGLMQDKVCKTKECRKAIQSILNRRSRLLSMKLPHG
jgi:hypothetical protein